MYHRGLGTNQIHFEGDRVESTAIPRTEAPDAGKWLPVLQTLAFGLVLVLAAAMLHLGENPFIAFAFTGAFVTHLMFRPDGREGAGAVLCWARALGEFGATVTFAGSFPGQTETMPIRAFGAVS